MSTIDFFGKGARRLLYAGLLLASLAPPASAQSSNMSFSVDGAPVMGDPAARVVIIEFADYQCPYCAQHANQAMPQIIRDYVKTGKVRYFFKDFPIEALHAQAFKAAESARCAGEQRKYWEMHDRLMQNQGLLMEPELVKHASALGLDLPKFQQCLDNRTYAAQIVRDVQEGKERDVPGTPQFYLGTLDTQGARMTVVTALKGSQPYSAFKDALDAMLRPEVLAPGTGFLEPNGRLEEGTLNKR